LPQALPRSADERRDAPDVPHAREGRHGGPPRARRGGVRRSRDAGPAAAGRYLRRATELYLKRLIGGGLERVYELGKDFRNEGVSFKHNPEFTQLEWYEAYADYRDIMGRIEQLVERVATEVLGTTCVTFRGHEIEFRGPWERVRFVRALERHELW